MYLVLSAFTSSLISLVVTTKASAFSFTVCALPPNILTSSAYAIFAQLVLKFAASRLRHLTSGERPLGIPVFTSSENLVRFGLVRFDLVRFGLVWFGSRAGLVFVAKKNNITTCWKSQHNRPFLDLSLHSLSHRLTDSDFYAYHLNSSGNYMFHLL